jgi:hypothetical protein
MSTHAAAEGLNRLKKEFKFMNIPDFSMTTLEAAMANAEAAVKLQVEQFNQQLTADYKTKFSNWSISSAAGREAGPMPEVPYGYMVGFFIDSTNGKARWAFPQRGPDPVMAPLKPPPVAKPYVPPVLPEPDNIRNVPAGDTMPVGYILTEMPSGARWQKQSSHTPFGIAYYYLKVA